MSGRKNQQLITPKPKTVMLPSEKARDEKLSVKLGNASAKPQQKQQATAPTLPASRPSPIKIEVEKKESAVVAPDSKAGAVPNPPQKRPPAVAPTPPVPPKPQQQEPPIHKVYDTQQAIEVNLSEEDMDKILPLYSDEQQQEEDASDATQEQQRNIVPGVGERPIAPQQSDSSILRNTVAPKEEADQFPPVVTPAKPQQRPPLVALTPPAAHQPLPAPKLQKTSGDDLEIGADSLLSPQKSTAPEPLNLGAQSPGAGVTPEPAEEPPYAPPIPFKPLSPPLPATPGQEVPAVPAPNKQGVFTNPDQDTSVSSVRGSAPIQGADSIVAPVESSQDLVRATASPQPTAGYMSGGRDQSQMTPLQHARSIQNTQNASPAKRMMDDITVPSYQQGTQRPGSASQTASLPPNLPTQDAGNIPPVVDPRLQNAAEQYANPVSQTQPAIPAGQFDLQSTITTPEQLLGLKESQLPQAADGGGDKGQDYFNELYETEKENKKTYMIMGIVILLLVVSFIVIYMLLSRGESSLDQQRNLDSTGAATEDGSTPPPTQNNNTSLTGEPSPATPIPQPTEPVTHAKTPPSPLVNSIPDMLTRPYPINNPNLSELRGVFDSLKAQEFPQGSITYIPIELNKKSDDTGSDRFINAHLFIEAMGIDVPAQFLDTIEPTLMLYAYSPTEDDRAECARASLRSSTCPGIRLGVVFQKRASPGVGAISLPNLVSNWIESSDISTLKPLVLDNVIFPNEATFKHSSYGDLKHSISYLNLPHPSTAVNFAIVDRYLIVGTSRNSVTAMIDAITSEP